MVRDLYNLFRWLWNLAGLRRSLLNFKAIWIKSSNWAGSPMRRKYRYCCELFINGCSVILTIFSKALSGIGTVPCKYLTYLVFSITCAFWEMTSFTGPYSTISVAFSENFSRYYFKSSNVNKPGCAVPSIAEKYSDECLGHCQLIWWDNLTDTSVNSGVSACL